MTVEGWIEAAKNGDANAFNHLVTFYQATAYHVAYYQVGNEDDALDACQEAMLSAWRAMPRFEGNEDGFRAWLMRIVVNACRDRLRYEKRRPQVPIETERDGDRRVLPIPAPGQTPQEYAENSDVRSLLEQCLAQLSDDHREVILLDQSGLSYSEIAATLDIEIGTVKSRLSRARAAMRLLLGGQGQRPAQEPEADQERSSPSRQPSAQVRTGTAAAPGGDAPGDRSGGSKPETDP